MRSWSTKVLIAGVLAVAGAAPAAASAQGNGPPQCPPGHQKDDYCGDHGHGKGHDHHGNGNGKGHDEHGKGKGNGHDKHH